MERRLVRRATAEVSGQSLTPPVLKWALPLLGIAGLVLLIGSFWTMNRERGPAPVDIISQPVDTAPGDAVAVPAQAAAATASEGPGVEGFLRDAGDQADVESAMQTLAALWNIRYDPASGTACAQAAAQGLSCLYQRGTLNNVRQLNLPAMLTLTGSDGTSYQPVLVSTTATTGMLAAGEHRADFPLDAISELWFGQFLLLWRPPNGVMTELSRGVRNENVRWLRQSLAALDPEYRGEPPTSDLFDEELEQQLKAFQLRQRLPADGLAGAHTQAIIQSQLALEGTPRLSSGR